MNIRLAKLRSEKGINQEEAAAVIGVTRQAFSRYERGERELGYDALAKLAKFFDVSIDYLLGNSTYYYPDKVGAYSSRLTDDEKEILELYRRMNHAQRVRFHGYGEGMLGDDAAGEGRA